MSSCRSLSQSSLKESVKGLMAHPSTTPWSALDSIAGAKTHAREIQVVPWCVNSTGSSSSRVSCRGEVGVLLQGSMASTPGSGT